MFETVGFNDHPSPSDPFVEPSPGALLQQFHQILRQHAAVVGDGQAHGGRVGGAVEAALTPQVVALGKGGERYGKIMGNVKKTWGFRWVYVCLVDFMMFWWDLHFKHDKSRYIIW